MRTVYLNGDFVPESEATLSIYDLSVMQAAAAFEMTRSFGGEHFKLEEHIARLEQSCRLLSLPLPNLQDQTGDEEDCWNDLSWAEQVQFLAERVALRNAHGPGEEHRLLIVVSPGCAEMYRDLAGVIPHPFLYLADFPLRYTVAGFGKYFTEGVQCSTSNIQQVPDQCVPSAAKHRSRLHFHLAQSQAPPGTWPLLLDDDDGYTEAPGANLVFVRRGVVTGITLNALPGISLRTVMELTDGDDDGVLYALDEEDPADEFDFDELWLTGTPFCMLPVVSLDGKPIGDGKIGPVYTETLAKWNDLVGLDIAQQICDWDGPRIWTPDVERARTTHH